MCATFQICFGTIQWEVSCCWSQGETHSVDTQTDMKDILEFCDTGVYGKSFKVTLLISYF